MRIGIGAARIRFASFSNGGIRPNDSNGRNSFFVVLTEPLGTPERKDVITWGGAVGVAIRAANFCRPRTEGSG